MAGSSARPGPPRGSTTTCQSHPKQSFLMDRFLAQSGRSYTAALSFLKKSLAAISPFSVFRASPPAGGDGLAGPAASRSTEDWRRGLGAQRAHGMGRLRYAEGLRAPSRLHHRAIKAQINPGTLPIAG